METEQGIRRVVWLPKELDKQIEEIRRKIGYSRSGIYRYILTRFLEREILTKRKQVSLRPWEEIVGRLKAIETNSQTISAIINCTHDLEIALTYPNDTPEAKIIQNLNNHLGQKIAMLKTDIPEKPLIIKTLNETTVAGKQNLALWWFRRSLFLVAFIFLRSSFRFGCWDCVHQRDL